MTSSTPPAADPTAPGPVARGTSVVILGTDALLAALPASPVQLAQACLAAGFAAAVPAAWGDEVLAAAAMRQLATRDHEPAILCVCPNVYDRLLHTSADLERFLIPLVAPPVAAARYLRALYGDAGLRITYVGACSSGADAVIDEWVLPARFLQRLAARGIDPARQPADTPPAPGHRRFRSLPGGAPTPEVLWTDGGRMLTEVEGEDVVEELAQRLIARELALFDLAPRMGCVCSGAIPQCPPHSARAAVASIEPPRARGDVLAPAIRVEVSRPLPRSIAPSPVTTPPEAHPAYRRSSEERVILADRPFSAGSSRPRLDERALASTTRRRPPPSSGLTRAIAGHPPVRRDGEGRALPRAYRGPRPRPTTATLWEGERVSPQVGAEREVPRRVAAGDTAAARRRSTPSAVVVPLPTAEPYRVPLPPSDTAMRARLIAAVVVALVLIVLGALLLR